ncbi:MAG: hypothetical protein ABIH23_15430 [bacterium]
MSKSTSRQRIQKLLAKEIPDRMGLLEHFWPETVDQYWPEQGYPKGIETVEYFDFDIHLGPWPIDASLFPKRNDVQEESDEWIITTNDFGAVVKNWKNKSGTPSAYRLHHH